MVASIMFAKRSTLVVKIECFQQGDEEEWQNIGDAIFIFSVRNAETMKAFMVPDIRISEHEDKDFMEGQIEIASKIKKESIYKAQKDLHIALPTYEESS